jgi:glycosyltransferase involved in cell wall biosynthesis
VRWPVGGIRTHILYNYPTLAHRGFDFTFIAPADETLDTFRASLTGLPAECIGVPVRGKRCGLWRELRRQLKTRRFDLLHSHGLTAAVHASLANIGIGCPHVATLHDVFRPCHFAGASAFFKRPLLSFLLNQVHTLIAVSDDVRANLFDYLPAVAKRAASVVTITNGILPLGHGCQPPTLPAALRETLNLDGSVRLIGFLGRFMEQKGFLPLVHALRELRDSETNLPFHLVAVGSGDYRNEYAAAVRRLGLTRHVSIVDFTPDVRPLLHQLDLLVVPSQWEASSLVAMEAMTAGIPVLGTDCIGLREVLCGTPARTVPVGDVHALAVGMREALEKPWTAEARAFVPSARKRFDNAPSAHKLAAVFDALVLDRHSRR